MANYFWSKYNNNQSSSTTWVDGGSQIQASNVPQTDNFSGDTSWSFDSSTGNYVLSGSYITITPGNSGTVYQGGGHSLQAYVCHGSTYDYWTRSATQQTTYYNSRGSFIGTYVDAYGAHVNNQLNSDGYWWVRGGLADVPTVTSPNGGETWNAVQNITWSNAVSTLQYQVQLSTDDGSTWKDIVSLTSAGASSCSYDFTNEPQVSTARVRVRAYDGNGYSDWDQSDGVFTIQHNVAPNAPTKLTPSAITIDRAVVQRFTWQHNDPNFNDMQSKFDLQWRLQGNATWNTITQATNNQYYDMSANVLPAGTIEWQVRTYDQAGLNGAYSALTVFTAGSKSDAPVITSPSSQVPISNPTVQWSSADQQSYQIVITDSLGNIIWDTGEVISINKAMTVGVNLTNGGQYTIKVRVKDSGGIWSDYASLSVTVSYTPPAQPSLTLDNNSDTGCITISLTDGLFPVTTSPASFVGTGNGTLTGLTSTIGITNTHNWEAVCTTVATDGGTFDVKVDGTVVGQATVGTSFTYEGLSFTINDGTTDFALNDSFTWSTTAIKSSDNTLYRRKQGDTTWIEIGSLTSIFYDYQCPYGDYEYSAIATGDNGVNSTRSDTQMVSSDFNGWRIVDKDTNQTFSFVYNIPDITVSMNEERYELHTFSSKPFIRYGAYQTEKGSLSGLQFSESDISTRDYVSKLQDMVKTRKTYFLKNDIGDSWTVNLFNFQRTIGSKIVTDNNKLVENVSLEWIEV